MNARFLAIAIASAFALGSASAQQFVYPAKGQKPEQQKKDEAECSAWAAQQAPAQPAATPPTTATGTTPGAGMRGAARGAVAAEIVGGEADRGAAAGAGFFSTDDCGLGDGTWAQAGTAAISRLAMTWRMAVPRQEFDPF